MCPLLFLGTMPAAPPPSSGPSPLVDALMALADSVLALDAKVSRIADEASTRLLSIEERLYVVEHRMDAHRRRAVFDEDVRVRSQPASDRYRNAAARSEHSVDEGHPSRHPRSRHDGASTGALNTWDTDGPASDTEVAIAALEAKIRQLREGGSRPEANRRGDTTHGDADRHRRPAHNVSGCDSPSSVGSTFDVSSSMSSYHSSASDPPRRVPEQVAGHGYDRRRY